MEEPSKHKEFLFKVVGAMFAAVIAPILTGIVLYYIQKYLDKPKPESPAKDATVVAKAESPGPSAPAKGKPEADRKVDSKPTTTTKTKDPSASLAALDVAPAAKSTVRRPFLKRKAHAVQRLFNGQDLTGFDTYLGAPQGRTSPYGKNNDPERVFTVSGGQLHVSGKVMGGLVTHETFENYHLTVEYKLGEKRWPPRENGLRSSGIVLHATGAPGEVHGWSMAGITCQIGELDTGSLAVPNALAKPISLSASAEKIALKKADRFQYVYKPGEPVTTLQTGSIHRLDYHPPLAKKAALGKSSRVRVNPVGDWNKLECICAGDRITITLNGTVVNVATRVSQARGKIFIESRGAEISFRTIELKPQP
jgi:hypothetical protein